MSQFRASEQRELMRERLKVSRKLVAQSRRLIEVSKQLEGEIGRNRSRRDGNAEPLDPRGDLGLDPGE